MLVRKCYIEKIKNLLHKEKMIFLLGPRQAWKTTLLFLLKEDKKVKKIYPHIVYYNFEDTFGNKQFTNKRDFCSFLITETGIDFQDKNTLLMLDEVQSVENAEAILKTLYDDKDIKAKIIVTGSGMWHLAQTPWATLVGRWAELMIYPFDFQEYVESQWLKYPSLSWLTPSVVKQLLPLREQFCTWGWYPAVVLASSQEEKLTELGKIITRFLDKDIAFWITKKELPNFEKVLQYLVRNTWNLLKYETIAQQLGMKTKAIESYIYFLTRSFVVHQVYPFFTDNTKELTTHPKTYLWDTWLITFLTRNYDTAHDGRVIENAIFLELLKNKTHTHDAIKTYKKISKSEIDFIYQYSNGDIIPIEAKAGNSLTIPQIFYSFMQEYSKTKKCCKTISWPYQEKKLSNKKKIIFVPWFAIWVVI